MWPRIYLPPVATRRPAIEAAWVNMVPDIGYRGSGAHDLVLAGNRGVGKTLAID